MEISTNKQHKNINIQSLLLQMAIFIRYCGDAFFFVYLSRLLSAKGFNDSQIGLLLTIEPIVGLICNPIWNIIGKDCNVGKKLLKILTVIEGIGIIIYTQATGLTLLAVIAGCCAVCSTPTYNFIDSYALCP